MKYTQAGISNAEFQEKTMLEALERIEGYMVENAINSEALENSRQFTTKKLEECQKFLAAAYKQ